MEGRITEINAQIEALAAQMRPLVEERRRLEAELFRAQVAARPVVYRIRFDAQPTDGHHVPFTSYWGCFSTAEKALMYVGTFETRLDHHRGRVSVAAIASETLSADVLNMLDTPVHGHNYS
jgi:hypothetical protein